MIFKCISVSYSLIVVEMTQQWWSQGLRTRNNYFKKEKQSGITSVYVLYNNLPGYRSFAGVLLLYIVSVFKENAAWLAAASRAAVRSHMHAFSVLATCRYLYRWPIVKIESTFNHYSSTIKDPNKAIIVMAKCTLNNDIMTITNKMWH